MAEITHGYKEQTTLQTRTGTSTIGSSNCSVVGGTDITWEGNTEYVVLAKAVFGGSSASAHVGFTVRGYYPGGDLFSGIASGAQLTGANGRYEPTYITQGEGIGYFYVHSFTTVASPTSTAEVQLAFQTWDTGETVWADQQSLMVINLDEISGSYVEASDTGGVGVGSSSWGNVMAAIASGSLSGDTEYLVLGCAQFLVDDNKTQLHVRLVGDSDGGNALDQLTYSSAEGEDAAEARIYGVMGRVLTASSPSVGIEIQAYAESTGDYTENHSYLIAIDTSAFDGFAYGFDATGGTTVTNTPTSLVTAAPDAKAADHLYLGRWNYTSGGNEGRASASILLAGGTQDQVQNSAGWNQAIYGGTGTLEAGGQSFVAGVTQTVYMVYFRLSEQGTVTDGLIAKVYTGSMGGTLVATSAVMTPPGCFDIINSGFLFPGGFSVSNGTTYYISIERTGSRDVSNYAELLYSTGVSMAGIRYVKENGSWSTPGDTHDLTSRFPNIYQDLNYYDRITYQTQAWDPTDAEAIQIMGVAEAATGDTVSLTGIRNGADSDLTSEYEFVAVLDLTLAAAAAPVFPRRQLTTVRM